MPPAIDLTGQRFGRLTVQHLQGHKSETNKNRVWFCFCDCGSTLVVLGHSLRTGETKSCGCLHRERASQAALTHGHSIPDNRSGSPEYRAYKNAKTRCTWPKHKFYAYYGGRGIRFLFDSFEQFFAELGPKPEPKHLYSVDRIKNDGHYEPGNVRWSTWSEQRRNQRAPKKPCRSVVLSDTVAA